MEALIARAMAARIAAGLSVEVTGIADRDEPHRYHFTTAAERDAYIERCAARGETVRVLTSND